MKWLVWGIIFLILIPCHVDAAVRRATPIFHVHQTKQKIIAFTFDDGPDPNNTPALLDVLRREKVKATFFVLGNRARRHPRLLRRMAAAGHEIGNHGYSHSQFRKLTSKQVSWELATTEKFIMNATGQKPRSFRSPYGQITPMVQQVAWRKGYRLIEWSVDPRDWQNGKSASTIQASVEPYIHTGDIVLFHDGGGNRRETVKAVSKLIHNLKQSGYTFVTISELVQRV